MKVFCILLLCIISFIANAQEDSAKYAVSDSILLQEVLVKANKKIVALKSDRYVVDATQIRTGKVNLSDLLRDVPGVTNDRGNLSILGKNAVKIMINGRLRQVSGDQVEDLLKSYSASEVQKIEVI